MKTYEEMTLEERIKFNLEKLENGEQLPIEPEPEELPKEFFKKTNNLWYTLDPETWTYFPNLTAPEDEPRQGGMYTHCREKYLKEEKYPMFVNLLYSGTLNKHLNETSERCHEMEARLMKEIGAKEGLTEELKAKDWWAYVQLMENIKNRVQEIVLNELVYV